MTDGLFSRLKKTLSDELMKVVDAVKQVLITFRVELKIFVRRIPISLRCVKLHPILALLIVRGPIKPHFGGVFILDLRTK